MLSLTVNGETQPVLAHAGATLLETLRDSFHLTGTKRGCDIGVCGACTVLIDGVPMRACLALAATCPGRAVTTIEGLADRLALTSIQQTLLDLGAVQCGFCTPGIAMTLTALFAETPNPTIDGVREAISGNLCRCSGYSKIVEAAMALSRRGQG